MTTRQMTEAQIARFWRAMEEQNVKVTRTKKGLMLRLPDGTSTMKHFTESDVKAPQNLISRLRRSGVKHPDDPRGPAKLPSYITGPKPKQKTLDRALEVIEKLEYPARVATSDLYDVFSVQDAPRMLHFLGYTPSVIRGARGMRLWDAPENLDSRFMNQGPDVVDEPSSEEGTVVLTSERGDEEEITTGEAITEHREEMEDDGVHTPIEEPVEEPVEEPIEEPIEESVEVIPVPEETPEDLQYIDMRDSWTPDAKDLLGGPLYVMVKDRLAVLEAVGIDWEIRVWRR